MATPSQAAQAAIFARPGASETWTIAHVSTASASATGAYVQTVQGQIQPAYNPEPPHDPELGPVDAFTGFLLAGTTLAIGVRRFGLREVFYFSRSVDEPRPG